MMTRTVLPGKQSLPIGGIEQHFEVAGRGPYCIVHSGGPGINSGYLRLPLLEDHFTMIYLDPIGTGRSGQLSTHPTGYTIDRFADQLLGLIDAFDLGKPYLLGHSHGAFVALEAALRNPDGVTGLILHAGAAYTGGDFMAAAGANVATFLERHSGTHQAVAVEKGWVAIPSIRSDQAYTTALRDLLPVYFADFRRCELVIAGLTASLEATMLVGDSEPFDVRDQLPGIVLPTLVLAGTHDFILGPPHAATLMDGLPNARLVQFDRSGHFAHLEEPEAFSEAVIAFASPA